MAGVGAEGAVDTIRTIILSGLVSALGVVGGGEPAVEEACGEVDVPGYGEAGGLGAGEPGDGELGGDGAGRGEYYSFSGAGEGADIEDPVGAGAGDDSDVVVRAAAGDGFGYAGKLQELVGVLALGGDGVGPGDFGGG